VGHHLQHRPEQVIAIAQPVGGMTVERPSEGSRRLVRLGEQSRRFTLLISAQTAYCLQALVQILGRRRVLLPVIDRYRDRDIPKYFRGDSAFALPKLFRLLEKEGFRYAIRIKANAVLERKIAHLLTRPVGRPSRKPKVFYHSFRYQAGTWECARRVVAKVEWHAGELFPRVGFIVTSLKWRAKKVVRFYNRRGTAEQWIKEGKNAVQWTKLSCRRFKDNAARLQLFALAYNLANFLRQLVLPKPIQSWTLTTLREKLIKIVAKVVAHARYVTFQLAEVAVPGELFARILGRIARLCPACASG
jgi:hypothetical protein